MEGELLTVIIVVATALAFDFTNGFHDTANVVATSISTRAMAPRIAVGYAAVLNFVVAFISLEVAATVASDVVNPGAITLLVVFGGLVGAIAWNLITWYFGLPSSSSHALVGALRPGPVTKGFRGGQVISGGLLALAHGTNDAQKTMGVIALALVAYGSLPAGDPTPPFWVIVSAAAAIALGTYAGGWRIIRTMGSRIHKMDSAQGFAAQGAGAAVILASTHGGFPLSTTHTISGAVIGSGAAKRLSAVRWGVAGNIVLAWVLTLPAAAVIGAITYLLTRVFGTGAAGPIIVSALIVIGAAVM